MAKITYKEINFQKASLALIEQCNEILEQYSSEGYDMTLRQLYYQLVSRDIIPNNQKQYNRIGSLINDARLAGLVDWEHITDRTRNVRSLSHWDTPAQIIKATTHNFRLDKWASQPNYIEVWIEKDALAGVFERVCNRLDVPYFSCRGYTSQSEMWSAAQRLDKKAESGKHPIILHFGDHDPSGIDMTRDIFDRLKMFSDYEIKVERLALNIDQVRQYNPPPNPAKLTDSRVHTYIKKFGSESWELDALPPETLADLVQSQINELLDMDAWDEVSEKETAQREVLDKISANFQAIERFLEDEEE